MRSSTLIQISMSISCIASVKTLMNSIFWTDQKREEGPRSTLRSPSSNSYVSTIIAELSQRVNIAILNKNEVSDE